MLKKALMGGGIDSRIALWGTAVGGASPSLKRSLSAFMRALDAGGVTPLLGRLHVRGLDTATQALTCLLTRTVCVPNNVNLQTAFTPRRGILYNGTSSYSDWGIAQNAVTGFGLNAGHLMQFIDAADAVNSMYLGGEDGGGNVTWATLPAIDGTIGTRFNTATTVASSATAGGPALYIADRISSSQVVVARNGTDVQTLSSASTGISTGNVYEGAENGHGTARLWHASRPFATSSGNTLGTAGRAAFSAALNQLAKSLGQGGF